MRKPHIFLRFAAGAQLLVVLPAALAMQTVAEMKAAAPTNDVTDMLAFVAKIPTSREAAIAYLLLAVMPFGMFAGWFAKYFMLKTIDESVIEYFFRSHTRRTWGAVGAYVGTCALALSTGLFFNEDTFTGWYSVIWMGLSTAANMDLAINKGSQGGWTEAQREAEREKQQAAAERKGND